MNYLQTLEYLFTKLPVYHRIGETAYKEGLQNTNELCQLLGNPENSFRSIHIAGTNGKGSVSHMLASILQESGLKTGLFTSPHLKDFRERIRINGIMIPEDKVVSFVEKYKDHFEKIGLSFFEMTVGLAFDFFREEKVDIAVIEVGLGGRLDSTNVITPIVSVITNISFDHMQLLGDTLQKIASEKAGIIKNGIPVIIGETQRETETVFTAKAKSENALLSFADEHLEVINSYLDEGGMKRHLDIISKGKLIFKDLLIPLPGNYQEKNILTVLETCNILQDYLKIDQSIIRKGLERVIINTGLTGRWQVISKLPLTICDTGHNEAGITEIITQINETPHSMLHFVFGAVNDKDIDKILSLLPEDAIYYFCKADIPRGMAPDILKVKANAKGLTGKSYISVKEALSAARLAANTDDLIFIGGSTFVVAEVL